MDGAGRKSRAARGGLSALIEVYPDLRALSGNIATAPVSGGILSRPVNARRSRSQRSGESGSRDPALARQLPLRPLPRIRATLSIHVLARTARMKRSWSHGVSLVF